MWANGKPNMERYDPTTKIKIQQPNEDNPTSITQVPTVEGRWTLGVHLSPWGYLTEEIDHLVQKAVWISVGFHRLPMSWKEWTRAYHTICIPQITYSLSVTHFMRKELETVMPKFISSALRALWCHGKYLWLVVFAPILLGGLRLLYLYYKQTIAQVKLFIGLSCVEWELENLFKIDLENFRLHAGTEHCPFSQP